MRKTFLVLFGVILVLSTFVLAWNFIQEREVTTCIDTDFGLNEEIQGNTYGLDLNFENYTFEDYCRPDGFNLIEFSCNMNITTNQTFVQAWEHNCSLGNFTNCTLGRCM